MGTCNMLHAQHSQCGACKQCSTVCAICRQQNNVVPTNSTALFALFAGSKSRAKTEQQGKACNTQPKEYGQQGTMQHKPATCAAALTITCQQSAMRLALACQLFSSPRCRHPRQQSETCLDLTGGCKSDTTTACDISVPHVHSSL